MNYIKHVILSILTVFAVACSTGPKDSNTEERTGKVAQAFGVTNLNHNTSYLSNDYVRNSTYATTKATNIFGNAATLQLTNFFVNGGKFNTGYSLIDAPIQTQTLLQTWHNSGTTADLFVWLNADITSTSTGPDISNSFTRLFMAWECLKFVYYDDELTSMGLAFTGYLGSNHTTAPSNPAHPGDVVRFHGCLWDLEATGSYSSTRVSNYQALTYTTYYQLNPSSYKYDNFVFGLHLVAPATNAAQWTGDDAIHFLANGVTGYAGALYDSSYSCNGGPNNCSTARSAFSAWAKTQAQTWLNVVNFYGNGLNLQQAKLWLGVEGHRGVGCAYVGGVYSCAHDPNVEPVGRAANAVAAALAPGYWPTNSLTGAAMYVHKDGADSYTAQYLSSSTWNDWPQYCTLWLGTNCDSLQ